MGQFPVSQLPGLLGGLETGLKTAVVNLTLANTQYQVNTGLMNLNVRKVLMIYNPNAFDVYVSDSAAVTTANGFPIASGQVVSFEFYKGKSFAVYAVAGTAGGTLRVMEGG